MNGEIYVKGEIFELSVIKELTFPILVSKHPSIYVPYLKLFHINDFVRVVNEKKNPINSFHLIQ